MSANESKAMKLETLRSMSADKLWEVHELVAGVLARKIEAERALLDTRLQRLNSAALTVNPRRERRAYPKIVPKYRNPQNGQETWAGRGKQPRWLTAQLRSGKKLDDFLIRRSS
jgi:DNA-binding protein H-NS